jgi:RimJ/RimL family protein N-acetyltransferase
MKIDLRPDVTIAPITLDHAAAMCRWMCDPSVSRNVGLRTQPSMEKTLGWIRHALQDPTTKPYAILLDDQHVGNVVLDRIDAWVASARLSIYVGQTTHRGSAIGRTAIYLATQAGFQTLGLHKVWAIIHVRNWASISAFHGAGFSVEGVLRDEFALDGQRLSVLYMGMLEDEFKRLDPRERLG